MEEGVALQGPGGRDCTGRCAAAAEYGAAPELLSAATLAYLGDAIYELMVRERLLADGVLHSSRLHRRALRLCSAAGQAIAARAVLPLLSEEEAAAYRRGRNASLSAAKKKNPAIHTAASGLEVLFGQLYLQRHSERMRELFAVCYQSVAEGEQPEKKWSDTDAKPEPD